MLGIKINLSGHIFETEEDRRNYHNRLWYYKVYCKLIEKNIPLGLDKKKIPYYTEEHHILPKCMGGNNDKSNRVRLSAREHIMAHILLAKIYPTNFRILKACGMMLMRNTKHREDAIKTFSTKVVAEIRELSKNAMRGLKLSEDHKRKDSEGVRRFNSTLSEEERKNKYTSRGHLGKHHSEETKKTLSQKQTGKKHSEETKRKMSEMRKGEKHPCFGKKQSKEQLEKLSRARKGRKVSQVTKDKIKQYWKTHVSPKSRGVIDDKGNEFTSIKDCANFYNLSSASILNRIKKGIFKYKD